MSVSPNTLASHLSIFFIYFTKTGSRYHTYHTQATKKHQVYILCSHSSVISLPINPILLHPPPLPHPSFLIQVCFNASLHGLQFLGTIGGNLDGQSRWPDYGEVVPLARFVGVLDGAMLVEDFGASDIELLDLHRELAVGGLRLLDGSVILGLVRVEQRENERFRT